MSLLYGYIRLFDIEKYQKIQPVLQKINNISFDESILIPFVKESIQAIENIDYQTRNPDLAGDALQNCQDLLKIIDNGDFRNWMSGELESIYSTSDITMYNIFESLCCPFASEVSNLGENDEIYLAPRSVVSFGRYIGNFYSERSIESTFFSCDNEVIPFLEKLIFLKISGLEKFQNIVFSDHKKLTLQENKLYTYKGSSGLELILSNQSPVKKDGYEIVLDRERQASLIHMCEYLLDLLNTVKLSPSFILLMDLSY
jgi:hypothetical protein